MTPVARTQRSWARARASSGAGAAGAAGRRRRRGCEPVVVVGCSPAPTASTTRRHRPAAVGRVTSLLTVAGHQQRVGSGDRHARWTSTPPRSATTRARSQSFSYAPDGGAVRRARTPGGRSRPPPRRSVRSCGHCSVSSRVVRSTSSPTRRAASWSPSSCCITTTRATRRCRRSARSSRWRRRCRARRPRPPRRAARATESGRAALDAVDGAARGAIPPTAADATRQLAEDSKLIRGSGARSAARADRPHDDRGCRRRRRAGGPRVAPGRAVGHASIRPASRTTAGSCATTGRSTRSGSRSRGGRCRASGIAAGVRGAIEPVVISRAEHTAGAVAGVAGDAVGCRVRTRR